MLRITGSKRPHTQGKQMNTTNPSRETLFWYAHTLEQFIQDKGHSQEELLAHITNTLTQKEQNQ